MLNTLVVAVETRAREFGVWTYAAYANRNWLAQLPSKVWRRQPDCGIAFGKSRQIHS